MSLPEVIAVLTGVVSLILTVLFILAVLDISRIRTHAKEQTRLLAGQVKLLEWLCNFVKQQHDASDKSSPPSLPPAPAARAAAPAAVPPSPPTGRQSPPASR